MEKQKSYGACVSKERCLEILTDEVQDHLPKEKWEDYERAVNRVRYEFSKLDGGWIPVDERLPEEAGTYIVNALTGERSIVTFAK